MTIREAIEEAVSRLRLAGVPDPALEARLLLQLASGLSAESLIAGHESCFPESSRETLEGLLGRRLRREPYAYIAGRKEFYGRTFNVDSRVMIPRPETELLAEKAIEFLQDLGEADATVLDAGTGSGVLAITLAAELPGLRVTAIDSEDGALNVARGNAHTLGVADRIEFVHTDIADGLPGGFTVVVSNPPYVLSGALPHLEPELSHEPRRALDGGRDGMEALRPLIASLPSLLRKGRAAAFIEIDPPVAEKCVQLSKERLPHASIEVMPDLAGLDRRLTIYT